jgi:hypothetical protein
MIHASAPQLCAICFSLLTARKSLAGESRCKCRRDGKKKLQRRENHNPGADQGTGPAESFREMGDLIRIMGNLLIRENRLRPALPEYFVGDMRRLIC